MRHKKVNSETHETKLKPNSMNYNSKAGKHKNHRNPNFPEANSSNELQPRLKANPKILEAQGDNRNAWTGTPRSKTKLRPNSIYKPEAGEHKNHRDPNFSQDNSSDVLQRGHEANTEVLDAQGIYKIGTRAPLRRTHDKREKVGRGKGGRRTEPWEWSGSRKNEADLARKKPSRRDLEAANREGGREFLNRERSGATDPAFVKAPFGTRLPWEQISSVHFSMIINLWSLIPTSLFPVSLRIVLEKVPKSHTCP